MLSLNDVAAAKLVPVFIPTCEPIRSLKLSSATWMLSGSGGGKIFAKPGRQFFRQFVGNPASHQCANNPSSQEAAPSVAVPCTALISYVYQGVYNLFFLEIFKADLPWAERGLWRRPCDCRRAGRLECLWLPASWSKWNVKFSE